jgi:hypothetical protein
LKSQAIYSLTNHQQWGFVVGRVAHAPIPNPLHLAKRKLHRFRPEMSCFQFISFCSKILGDGPFISLFKLNSLVDDLIMENILTILVVGMEQTIHSIQNYHN